MVVENVEEVDSRDRLIEQLSNTVLFFEERLAELELARDDVGWEEVGGDAKVEFSWSGMQKIVNRSRLYFLQNALIRRAVNLQSDYVFAQGVNVQATAKLVNAVIQEFRDDVNNQRELTSHQALLLKEQTLMLDGNLFFVLFTDKAETGKVQIRSVLVDEITDIVTNPDDANEVWFYKREWMSKPESGYSTKQNVVYYPDIDYKLIPGATLPKTRNGKPILWDAPVLHVKTGALAKSRYGLPETYPALDWALVYKKMLEDWATIVRAYAVFAFKVTAGTSAKSVAAAKTKLGSTVAIGDGVEHNPRRVTGSMFATTKDGATIEPIRTAGATTSARDSRELRLQVAAAMGLPDPMLSGEVDVGNLATAKTLDRPTELKFRSRQMLWQDVITRIINHVLRYSIIAPKGMLNKYVTLKVGDRGDLVYDMKIDPETNEPINLHTEVVFPPILEHTILDRIEAINQAVTLNGKTLIVDSPELMKTVLRLQLQALGLSNVDELLAQMLDDIIAAFKAKKDAQKAATQADKQTNDTGNTNNSNGNGEDDGAAQPKAQPVRT